MTCFFDPAQALCQMRWADTGDHRRTPDLDDCRPPCRNIARIDRDINAVRVHAEQLAPGPGRGLPRGPSQSFVEMDQVLRYPDAQKDVVLGGEVL
jgi:hypothetical protein